MLEALVLISKQELFACPNARLKIAQMMLRLVDAPILPGSYWTPFRTQHSEIFLVFFLNCRKSPNVAFWQFSPVAKSATYESRKVSKSWFLGFFYRLSRNLDSLVLSKPSNPKSIKYTVKANSCLSYPIVLMGSKNDRLRDLRRKRRGIQP